MTKTVNVRGVAFDSAKATTTLKSIKTANQSLALFLEAGGKQASFYGNFDWLNRLFEADPENNNPLLKGNGDLSVKGKAAKAYLAFHFPSVKLEKNEAGQFKASWTKNDKYRYMLCSHVDDGAKLFSPNVEDDCYLTFQQWENKDKKKQDPKGPTAKAAAGQIAKWLEALRGEGDALPMEGMIEEFNVLAALAGKLVEEAQYKRDYMMALSNGDQSIDAQADRALAERDATRPTGKRETRVVHPGDTVKGTVASH